MLNNHPKIANDFKAMPPFFLGEKNYLVPQPVPTSSLLFLHKVVTGRATLKRKIPLCKGIDTIDFSVSSVKQNGPNVSNFQKVSETRSAN